MSDRTKFPGALRRPGGGLMAPGQAGNRVGLLLIAVTLAGFFSVVFPNFGTLGNASSITISLAAITIAAVGSAFLIILGRIDLSIGSMYSLVAVTVAIVNQATGNAWLGALAGLLTGLALGTINGLLVRALTISPIIVTVATMIMFSGLAYLLTGGNTVGGQPDPFTQFGRSNLFGIPTPVVIAVMIFLVAGYVLTRTPLGLRVYAVGGNERAATLSGVRSARLVLGAYMTNGVLIGLAGVLTTARLGIAAPNTGVGFEFDVLTAVILGGVAFTGGAGRPLGILYGIIAIGVLNAGVVFAGLPFYFQSISQGALLLLALGSDQIIQASRARKLKRSRAQQRVGRDSTHAVEVSKRHQTDPQLTTVEPVLVVSGLTKRYGAVQALEDAGLVVRPGEVVCLLGDNGAGKSTLVKMISGALQPDAGTVSILGEDVTGKSPNELRAAGLETVYQDLALCPNLSVAHNMVLGAEPVRRLAGVIPWRDDRAALTLAHDRLTRLGAALPAETNLVEHLSGGQRQAVAIARALHEDVRVAILDEPTAALGVHQTAAVLNTIRAAADQGTGIILISHDIATVLAVADRVVVLRLGRVTFDGQAETLSELDLLQLMAGIDSPLSGAELVDK
jgi:ribose/xylose/arabinose/galactoside ABC-type transport system permease subunit/ABC-type branched-subunit amino acid transport system ATPase component